jgi:rhodanese-related sulfurtransferase
MATSVKRVSPAEAKALCDQGYLYVDVRSEPEFEQGRPAGSVNVPLLHAGAGGMTPNPEFLSVMQGAFPKDAKIVVGCRSGGRSLRAATALIEAGYTDVIDQRAGFDGARDAFGAMSEKGWGPAGLPVTSGAAPGASYADVQKKKG